MGRIILSICGSVLALALMGAQQQGEQPHAQGGANEGGAPAPQSTTSSTPAYRAYPERYSDACYGAQDHDAADLCAQWRAAIAAEKAADEARIATIASIIGTVLSLATVIGLIVTIAQTNGALGEARRGNRLNLMFERRSRRESRRAAEEQAAAILVANRNADAAAKHVAIAQDSAERRLRAYVKCKATFADTIVYADNETAVEKYLIHFIWENTGDTPGRRVVQGIKTELFLGDIPDDYVYERVDVASFAAIGPRSTCESDIKQIKPEDIGSRRVYIIGFIEYDDAFGQRRRTEICQEMMFSGNPTISGSLRGFAYRGPHNGFDDDCHLSPAKREPRN